MCFKFFLLGTLPEGQLCLSVTWCGHGYSWCCWSFWSCAYHRCLEQEKSKFDIHTQHSPSSWSHGWKCRIESKIWGKGIYMTFMLRFIILCIDILRVFLVTSFYNNIIKMMMTMTMIITIVVLFKIADQKWGLHFALFVFLTFYHFHGTGIFYIFPWQVETSFGF